MNKQSEGLEIYGSAKVYLYGETEESLIGSFLSKNNGCKKGDEKFHEIPELEATGQRSGICMQLH